jgi:anti-sigma factor RsiW
MFSCQESIELLLAYLEGDLPESEAAHLEEHLGGCPPCVDFLRSYKDTSRLCKQHLVRSMPEELSAKLTDFLRKKMCSK